MNGDCAVIWADFDRVKDQNEECNRYQEFLFTDSTSAKQSSQIYETWKVLNTIEDPCRILQYSIHLSRHACDHLRQRQLKQAGISRSYHT